MAALGLFVTAPALAADLCQGVVTDKLAHPMTALAKPAAGASVRDPMGGTLRRVTAVPLGGANPAIVPLFSTVSAWNADESRLLLYHVGAGHELYDGRSYRFIRTLDIAPPDIEQVYWHTMDPDILFYVDGRRLVRYRVSSGAKQPLHDFGFCTDSVSAGGDPMFMSWDSDEIGLKCGAQAFIYRVHDDRVLGPVSTSLSAPQMAPSGSLAYSDGLVLDTTLKAVRRLDLANPFEHASLGRSGTGGDAFNTVAFDPGPQGSGVGSLVSFNLQTGASRVVVGPASGYPYPPSGTHVSSLAYRQPGWVFVSVVGDPSGQRVLDNELVLADTATGRVCRPAHHRSFGRNNRVLGTPYWAEPHVVASPSGTRAIFASDWGGGATVDTYVLELPVYRPLGLTVAADKAAYTAGQRLSLSVTIDNPGFVTAVDLYLVAVLPDGQSVVAFTPTAAVPATVSNPGAWPAVLRGLDLRAPFRYQPPSFLNLNWSGNEPPGTYRFVLLAVEPGSLRDNRVDGWDTWATAVATVTFQR